MPETWNPRFVRYAEDQGRTAEDQLAHDRVEYPGGCMTGFVIWIQRRWNEWFQEQGVRRAPSISDKLVIGSAEHAAFDTWLARRKEAAAAVSPPRR